MYEYAYITTWDEMTHLAMEGWRLIQVLRVAVYDDRNEPEGHENRFIMERYTPGTKSLALSSEYPFKET